MGAAKYSTMGDAYVALNELDKAIQSYERGISKFSNSFTTPIMLKKLGLVYETLGNLDLALEAYKTIETDFPASSEGREVRKYIGRVESKMAL